MFTQPNLNKTKDQINLAFKLSPLNIFKNFNFNFLASAEILHPFYFSAYESKHCRKPTLTYPIKLILGKMFSLSPLTNFNPAHFLAEKNYSFTQTV